MRWGFIAFLPLAFQVDPAHAQFAPAKMVIVWTVNGAVSVTDYPNMTRCMQGAKALDIISAQKLEEAQPRSIPGGGISYGTWALKHFCIPG